MLRGGYDVMYKWIMDRPWRHDLILQSLGGLGERSVVDVFVYIYIIVSSYCILLYCI